MRLLPRSLRGIWLLAAAVWGASCAALWLTLPIEPREVLRMPRDIHFIAFGPDAKTAVVNRLAYGQEGEPTGSSCDLVDLSTYRPILELCDASQNVLTGYSADRRTWIFHRRDDAGPRFLRADLVARTVEPIVDLPVEIRGMRPAGEVRERLSPDGRFCVFHSSRESESILIWDLSRNRILPISGSLVAPVVFSASGHRLAAVDRVQTRSVRVFDLETLEECKTLTHPGEGCVRHLYLRDDGEQIAAAIDGPTGGRLVWAFDDDGEPAAWPSGRCSGPLSENLHVIAHQYPGKPPWGDDLSPLPRPTPSLLRCSTSPEGKYSIVPVRGHPSYGPIEKLLNYVGLRWPFKRLEHQVDFRLFDALSGERIARVQMTFPVYDQSSAYGPELDVTWIPDGTGWAVRNPMQAKVFYMFGVPPRKSLATFAQYAAIFASLIALVSWRYQRRLQTNPAAVT